MKKYKKLFNTLADSYRAKHRVAAECPYFGQCGGCQLQDIAYEQQLELKIDFLKQILQIDLPLEIIPATPWRYRNRMDFVYAFGKIGLRKAGNFRKVRARLHVRDLLRWRLRAQGRVPRLQSRVCQGLFAAQAVHPARFSRGSRFSMKIN